jgi:hypothetical protein
MNEELEFIWEEAVVVELTYNPCVFSRGTKEYQRQCPGRDSN